MERYSAIYRDQHGTIETELYNNGNELKMILNGVEFTSTYMDGFSPLTDKAISNRFELDKYQCLTNFSLTFYLPLKMEVSGAGSGQLKCELTNSLDHCDMNKAVINCSFITEEKAIEIGKHEQFETMFLKLNKKLSDFGKPTCCFNCTYSDYSVYGSQFWGSMLCFKNMKKEYLAVKDKDEFMEIMDSFDQQVQETYYCQDYEERLEGTGYRG